MAHKLVGASDDIQSAGVLPQLLGEKFLNKVYPTENVLIIKSDSVSSG